MHRWEYLRVDYPSDRQLVELGRQGWELVSTHEQWKRGTLMGGTTVIYLFKRPVADDQARPGQAAR